MLINGLPKRALANETAKRKRKVSAVGILIHRVEIALKIIKYKTVNGIYAIINNRFAHSRPKKGFAKNIEQVAKDKPIITLYLSISERLRNIKIMAWMASKFVKTSIIKV